MEIKKTAVLVFAGPNGSGKSTVTSMIQHVGTYINADDIKRAIQCDDLTAAQIAEKKRNECIDLHKDFTFETVLSTTRNLELLMRAKEQDYFIKSIFVLTASPQINLERVAKRVTSGGHDVPKDKILKRYKGSLSLLPELIKVSDICNVVDNTKLPFRIFSKKNGTYRLWENEFWSIEKIVALTGQKNYNEIHEVRSCKMIVDQQQLSKLTESGIKFQKAEKDGVIAIKFPHSQLDIVNEIIGDSSAVKQKPQQL